MINEPDRDPTTFASVFDSLPGGAAEPEKDILPGIKAQPSEPAIMDAIWVTCADGRRIKIADPVNVELITDAGRAALGMGYHFAGEPRINMVGDPTKPIPIGVSGATTLTLTPITESLKAGMRISASGALSYLDGGIVLEKDGMLYFAGPGGGVSTDDFASGTTFSSTGEEFHIDESVLKMLNQEDLSTWADKPTPTIAPVTGTIEKAFFIAADQTQEIDDIANRFIVNAPSQEEITNFMFPIVEGSGEVWPRMRLPSEKPPEAEEVLICSRFRRMPPFFLLAHYEEGQRNPWTDNEGATATSDVIGWWPLPKVEGTE